MKYLLLALTLSFANLLLADSWDNLTKEQADAVVAELEANPYIFDYCDCCDTDGVYAAKVRLLKVIKTEIIVCSWETESFSVTVETKVLANVAYTKDGPVVTDMTSKKKEEDIFTISMNYTWTFNKGEGKAAPFFTTVAYDKYGEKKSCKPYFLYPTPEQGKGIIKDGKYKKWFKKNIAA